MKETLKSNEYWLQKLQLPNIYNKSGFYDSTYLVINKNTLSRPGKISPNKVSITLLTDIE